MVIELVSMASCCPKIFMLFAQRVQDHRPTGLQTEGT